jgi:hypothetical protein
MWAALSAKTSTTRDYSSKAPVGAEIAGIVGRDFFADGLLVIARTVAGAAASRLTNARSACRS